MTNPPASQFPLQPVAWSEIARICRRICLLRERGQPEQAEQIRRNELEAALATMKATGATDEVVAHQLETVFAVEAERVANAAALAELLRPMLGTAVTGQRSEAEREESTPAAAPTPPPATTTIATREPAPAAPGDIASFIDDMLAQERARPDTPALRRVS